MSTRYIDAKCLQCGADAKIEVYTHYPGGRRLGAETLCSLDEKDCDCDWTRKEPEKVLEEKYSDPNE